MEIEYMYVDILTGENLSSIYWLVRSFSRRGGDGGKVGGKGYSYFSLLRVSFFLENLKIGDISM